MYIKREYNSKLQEPIYIKFKEIHPDKKNAHNHGTLNVLKLCKIAVTTVMDYKGSSCNHDFITKVENVEGTSMKYSMNIFKYKKSKIK